MANKDILNVLRVSKSFPGVKALDNMKLTLHKGEVMAIVGENGAGKSTLMKILSGIYTPDEGEIMLEGKKVLFKTPAQAEAEGIYTVHQELSVFPLMSVAENIFANRIPRTKTGLLNYKTLYSNTKKILADFEATDISPRIMVGSLDIARQQVVEILRATGFSPKILILDEPTSALNLHDTKLLFQIIKKLKQQGTSVIYISHRLEEIFEVCDSVTIMRDGAYITNSDIKSITKDEIVHYMVGRDVAYNYGKNTSNIGKEILRVDKLCCDTAVKNVSFVLKRGEVVGIGGLEGSGRTELLETLFGMRKALSGNIYIHGNPKKITSPLSAKKNGMAYITKDRKKLGLFIRMSIEKNILSGNLKLFSKKGFVQHRKIRAATKDCIKKFDIKTTSVQKLISTLSGGNQQKVLLGMWLLKNPEIILVDEPTRGIDVGTKENIHKLLRYMAKQGKAVLMVSSDMPELLSASDRIIIMCNGQISGELEGEAATEFNVMSLAVNETSNVVEAKTGGSKS